MIISAILNPERLVAERPGSYFAQVREQLLDTVRGGKTGDRIPSERELARQLGTSTLTVGRALQELQREGVVQRIPGKGTFLAAEPPPESRALKASSNGTAADSSEWDWPRAMRLAAAPESGVAANTVIFARLGFDPNLSLRRQLWGAIAVSRLERAIQQTGGKTIIVNREIMPDAEIGNSMRRLREAGVNSGVFIGALAEEENEAWLAALQQWQEEAAPPLVSLCLGAFSNNLCDSVRFDSGWGAYLAGRHLRELGHRAVAYVVPEGNFDFVDERFAGLKRAFVTEPQARLALIRVPVPGDVETTLPSPAGLEARDVWMAAGEAAARTLRDETRFSALVMANDSMARTFMEGLRTAGRGVPESLSVVGYDDRLNSSALGLTTLHPPIERMAEQAALLALRRLQQPFDEGWLDLVLKPQLIVRSSTRALGEV